MAETALMSAALGCYAAMGLLIWQPSARPAPHSATRRAMRATAHAGACAAAVALAAALVLHTLAIAVRWQSLGHGPFTTLYEALSSNLWSLALVFGIAWFGLRELRAGALIAWPVLALLALWLAVSDPAPGHLPATYATALLYLHALVGKLFLGLLLVAVSLALLPVLHRPAWLARRLPPLPGPARLDALAHRFAAFAFVFDSLLLVVGALWAQDAWGRWWDWDPLETWSFLTWIALALALHARASWRPAPVTFGVWLSGVFVLAFLTFFGVPFVSVSPHKGAV